MRTSPRTGRPPKLGESKSVKVGFRLTPTTVNKLQQCAEQLEKTRAEVVEKGIEMVYESLESQKEKDQ